MDGLKSKYILKYNEYKIYFFVASVFLLSLSLQWFSIVNVTAVVNIPATGVTISPVMLTLGKGTYQRLTATVMPLNATNRSVTWESSATTTATVDSTGLVRAISPGRATITVRTVDGEFSAFSVITVVTPVTGVTIEPSLESMDVGASLQLKATVTPSDATNKDITWSSSDTSILTVSGTGIVSAHRAGTAAITVTTLEGGFSDTRTITAVAVPVTGVTITPTVANVSLNRTLQLTANIIPLNATNKNVNWSSDEEDIASVDSTGLVTGRSIGTATITVRTADGNRTGTRQVIVAAVPVSGVTIAPVSATILIGASMGLTASVFPADASDTHIVWSSSNTGVATVNHTGLVSGISVGEAIITATTRDGNRRATSRITVGSRVTGVTLTPTTIRFSATGTLAPTQQLIARVIPSDAHDTRIEWSSSNNAVATVDTNGLVTRRTTSVGTAVITVRTVDGNHTATAVVTVANLVTGVTLAPATPAPITVGATQQLTATVAPPNATDRSVVWSSTNTSVATVSETGLIRGVGAGTATIRVTTLDGGHTASVNVTVNVIPVTGVTLTPGTATIGVNATQQLTAAVVPANATNRSVTWSSSDTSIASVSDTGLVAGLRAGSATITVRTSDGGRTATGIITVNFIPVTGVTLLPANVAMNAGTMLQLNAAILPVNASNRSLLWSSSNTSVAVVNENGMVAAIGQGNARITVTTVDGARTAASEISVIAVPVRAVALAPSSANISAGTSQQLTATIEPAGANKNVTWSSSNTSVATVNTEGLVTGIRAGTATITVRTADGGRTATSIITVTGQGSPLPQGQHNMVTMPVARGTTTFIRIENALEASIPPNAVTGQLAAATAWIVPNEDARAIFSQAQRQGLTPLSNVVMLTLSGGQLLSPVSVTLNFDATLMTAGRIPAIYAYNDRSDRWVYIGGNRTGSAVTAKVDRLSKFAVFASEPLPVMNDIRNHWGRNAILTLAGMDILGGYPDATFRPDKTVSRAEFASMLARALNLTSREQAAGRFTDSASFEWAKGAIGAITEAGLMGGLPDGSFGASRGITRAETAVILERVIRRNHVRIDVTAAEARFADEIPAWATRGVQAAVRFGLIGGFQDNTFRAAQIATRAEVATMLYRLIAQ